MSIGWLWLTLGVFGEVAWVLTLKSTAGFTKVAPSLLNLSIALLNIVLLSKAFNLLPTALSYSIWVGLSAVAIALFAWWFQGESMTVAKGICIGMVVLGVVGLKLFSVPGQ